MGASTVCEEAAELAKVVEEVKAALMVYTPSASSSSRRSMPSSHRMLMDASEEQKAEFAPWLDTVRDAAEDADEEPTAGPMDVNQQEAEQQDGQQEAEQQDEQQGDEQGWGEGIEEGSV